MDSPLLLNPEQRKAVEHGEGPLLVIAGPGSGKTRVITQRIVYLLRGGGDVKNLGCVQPENILALTFTEKAAEETKRRVREALPGLEKLPFISTFHAFCYHVLRERHFERQLLDETDVWIFLRYRMEQLGLEFYRKLAQPGAFLHALNEFFSRCQDELIEPEDFEAYVKKVEQDFARQAAGLEAEPCATQTIRKKWELARVFRTSRQLIEEAGCSSFGSLISETLRMWEREPEVLERCRDQLRFVLVDEFQDTNFVQVELLKRLVAPPYNITAVGDDDQAIYRFRGASHGAFQMFDRAFPGHETVYLDLNYRSTKKIVRAATVVISRNDRYQRKKALNTENAEGSKVYLVDSPEYPSEAVWVAQEIKRLGEAEGQGFKPAVAMPKENNRKEDVGLAPFAAGLGPCMSWGDIAVLYRSHYCRDLLVGELRRRNIPFTIRGLSILSTTILRDLVAYLNLVHSPHHNVSLTRVLLAARWRFPEELALDIRKQAAKDRCSLFDVLQAKERLLTDAAGMAALHSTGWPELKHLLRGLHEASRHLSMPALFDLLLDRLHLRFPPGDRDQVYVTAFRKFLEDWEKKNRDGALSAAGARGSRSGSAPESKSLFTQPGAKRPAETECKAEGPPLRSALGEFIEYFRYFLEAGGQIEAPDPPDASSAVQMMTVHAAKGLEFPIVFILGVGRQRFPHREEKPVIEFPDELRKGPPAPADIHLQEERRLFYVAMTRARQRLYISGIAARGKRPSLFVEDTLRDPAVATRDIERIRAPVAAAGTTLGAPFCGPRPATATPDGVFPPHGVRPRPASGPVQGNLFENIAVGSPRLSAVYPNISQWANGTPPNGFQPLMVSREGFSTPKLRLSASMIDTYRECPMKFKLSYCYRIPTAPQATLTFGNIMHQCLRHYFELRKKALPHFEELQDFYHRAWKDAGFEDQYQERAYQQAGLDQLREFVGRQNSIPLAADAIEFERRFTLELDDVVLVGRIDQINPLPGSGGGVRSSAFGARQVAGGSGGGAGRSAMDSSLRKPEVRNPNPVSLAFPPVELVDYKTGRPRSQKDADKSLQLSVYALAARRLLEVEPARLTFYNLTNNEPVSTVRTTKDLDTALTEMQAVAEQIRKGMFDPTPGFACKRCEYLTICPAHEEQ